LGPDVQFLMKAKELLISKTSKFGLLGVKPEITPA
jgi:hypothetical protein